MYNNASEVVREGLRLIERQDRKLEDLRNIVRVGFVQVDRGEYVVFDDPILQQTSNWPSCSR